MIRGLLKGQVDFGTVHEDGLLAVHSGWVGRNLEEKWTHNPEYFKPFSELPKDVRALDEPYAYEPVKAFRRMFIEVNRLATKRLFGKSAGLQKVEHLALEEELLALQALQDLVDVVTAAQHAAYSAHFLVRSKPQIRGFDDVARISRELDGLILKSRYDDHGGIQMNPVDITRIGSWQLPRHLQELNEISALEMIVAFTDLMAVQERGDLSVSMNNLVRHYVKVYVNYWDTKGKDVAKKAGKKVTEAQRRAAEGDIEALGPDELRLNQEMVELIASVFQSFVAKVGIASSEFISPRHFDPLEVLVGGSSAEPHMPMELSNLIAI